PRRPRPPPVSIELSAAAYCRLFVLLRFSDDWWLLLLVLFIFVVIVIVVIVIGIARRHPVAHDGQEVPLGQPVLGDMRGHVLAPFVGCRDIRGTWETYLSLAMAQQGRRGLCRRGHHDGRCRERGTCSPLLRDRGEA